MKSPEPALNELARPNYPIESVDRALRLLSIFRGSSSVSLSDVASRLGVSRSTAHRLLAMFVWHRYASQDPVSKEYAPGPALIELGLGLTANSAVLGRARTWIEWLAARSGETVHLVVLAGGQISFVDGIESDKPVRCGLRVGMSLPAHSTSGGKALLARLSRDRLHALYPLERLTSVTGHTVGSRSDLEAELAVVREHGYAVNDQESEDGLVAVGATLPGASATPAAALSISVPSSRASAESIARLGSLLLAVGERAP